MNTLYAISTAVGRKYGSWKVGNLRFATEAAALAEAKDHTARERQCGATPMTRMIVQVAA